MRKSRSFAILFVLFTSFIISCTKEGPEGPMGAQGTQGVPGTNAGPGPTGPAGPQGPVGTANVIYSAWMPSPTGFGPTLWADTTISTIGLVSRANFLAPSMTQAILDRGLTLVYHTFAAPPAAPTGGANAQSLPYSLTVNLPPLQYININYRPAVGRIVVFLTNLTPGGPSFGLLAGHFFRYIIVPGTIAGGRMMNGAAAGYTIEELQAMPYEQVLKKFNIPREGSNQ